MTGHARDPLSLIFISCGERRRCLIAAPVLLNGSRHGGCRLWAECAEAARFCLSPLPSIFGTSDNASANAKMAPAHLILRHATKLHLPRPGNEEGIEPSGPPRLSLWAPRRNLIGPPLR